jgi:hypothetical protein
VGDDPANEPWSVVKQPFAAHSVFHPAPAAAAKRCWLWCHRAALWQTLEPDIMQLRLAHAPGPIQTRAGDSHRTKVPAAAQPRDPGLGTPYSRWR